MRCGLHALGDPFKGSQKFLLGVSEERKRVPYEVLRKVSIFLGLLMSQLADPIRICPGKSKIVSDLDSGPSS